MRKPVVFCVVGLQNSGKTRFVQSILHKLKLRGLAVAVLKHDGHADKTLLNDWEKSGSDTKLALEAGADMTMVVGGGQSLLHMVGDSDTSNVYALCERMDRFAKQHGCPLDVIVIEGFKSSSLPKIVICRTEENLIWLKDNSLLDVRAVILPTDLRGKAPGGMPVFEETQVEEVLQSFEIVC